MERGWLELTLQEGLSLERIGELAGKNASTVGYWVEKHGLTANGASRHRSRGGLDEQVLRALVAEDLTTREIARRTDRCQATVRYWLRVHGLRTSRSGGPRRSAGRRGESTERRILTCEHHGKTEFWLEGRGIYRCLRCRSEAVSRRRRKVKDIVVEEAGGCCQLCGYDRCVGALHFHHLEADEKIFGLGERGYTRSLAIVRAEAAKCVLLCSNCHAEVEARLFSVGPRR